MSNTWQSHLERWTAAGVVDQEVGARIRTWEAAHPEPRGLRWPVWIALAFGVILLGAGVLLFVSAHWDQMSASQRMSLIVAVVAAFHLGGAATAGRFEGLSIALHTLGTISLGGAIALAGQIFNLSEHWPTAVLLWAAGAAVAWALLGHWTQATLVAVLFPYWLAAEWWTRSSIGHSHFWLPISAGVCALAFTYLSARRNADDSPLRKSLGWIGGVALLPAALAVSADGWGDAPPWQTQAIAWAIALLSPLALAVVLRGRDAVWAAAGIAWTLLLVAINVGNPYNIGVYLWCAMGSVGMALWGTIEGRGERINLGTLGFALTVLMFYFSSVMDKLDRAAGLIVVGILFLGGGWLLERTRRQLLARINTEAI